MVPDLVVLQSQATTLDAEHPWPGLDAFPESGRAFFHGRDREIERLARLVNDEPLVLLHGESGLGKTSLLQAGLFPRLRTQGFLPVLVRLDFSPAARPLAEQVRNRIAEELARERVDGPRPQPGERLWEYNHRPDGWLWSPHQAPLLPVVVLDQFEEIFTLGGGLTAPGVRDFVDEIAELVLDRVPARDVEHLDDFDRSRPGFRVVLSFREEFLAHVEELLPEFGPAMQARLRLSAFDTAMAERSVLGNGGPLVNKDVAERIVVVVSGGRETVEPSLLSVFCGELNERRLTDRAATISLALLEGAGPAVLPEFYARSTQDVAEPVLEFVEEKLLTEGQRRNIVTLEEALGAPGVTRPALDTLVRSRLVRIEERFGAERVELAHDVLAPIVAEVRRERRARREERRLAQRLELEQRESKKLNKERTRLRALLAFAVSGLVLASLGGIGAWVARERAKAAERSAAELAAQGYLFDAASPSFDSLLQVANAAAAAAVAPEPEVPGSGLLSHLSTVFGPFLHIRHAAEVTSAMFSPDGRLVVTAAEDQTVRVSSARTGETAMVFQLQGRVDSAMFSPDGTHMVTASAGTAQVWDVRTGVERIIFRQAGVTSAAFSPDGERVVTSADQTARVWGVRTSEAAVVLHHQGRVYSAMFSPDGARVVTASEDQTARVWDARTGAPVGAPLKHAKRVYSAMLSADGARVVTASEDQTARVWDARTGAPVTASLKHAKRVYSAMFSPDGARVVTASEDQTARVWDVRTGETAVVLHHQGRVYSAVFSPDGARVVTASEDQTARVWDARTGAPMSAPLQHDGPVSSAVFSPEGARVVTASADQTARVWDARAPVGAPLRHAKPVKSVVFSPEGARVVTASEDQTARVWDARTGAPVGAPLQHAEWVHSAVFSPDGARVVTASADQTARVWDARTGAPVSAPLQHSEYVASAVFSPDGTRVVTASGDGTARVWDARTGAPVSAPLRHAEGVRSAVFSPDGARVVTASADQTARVWDARTGAPLSAPLKHAEYVASAVFSPDGTRLVTASGDGTARVWDVQTGAPLGPPLQHAPFVASAVFSPDGARVLTASGDGTARVWEAETGAPLGAPLKHAEYVASAVFSPDGARVVTASGDGTARVWDARTGAPLGAPLQHTGRVYSAVFSADGARVVTASEDQTARLWDTRTIADSSLKQLLELAELVAGGKMRGLRDFAPSAADPNRHFQAWRERARDWANAPDGSFEQWVHWYFADPWTRPDQPGLWRGAPEALTPSR